LLWAVAPHRSHTNLDSCESLSSFFASLTAHTFADSLLMALSPFRDASVNTAPYLIVAGTHRSDRFRERLHTFIPAPRIQFPVRKPDLNGFPGLGTPKGIPQLSVFYITQRDTLFLLFSYVTNPVIACGGHDDTPLSAYEPYRLFKLLNSPHSRYVLGSSTKK